MGDNKAWNDANGDKTLLLDYPVENGIIVEAGGYLGDWVEKILKRNPARVYIFEPIFYEAIQERFKGDERVLPFPQALSDHSGFTYMFRDADASRICNEGGEMVELVDAAEFFQKELDGHDVDLLSINVEGHEYVILPRLIESGAIAQCRNIQVQFHDTYPNCEVLRDRIREGLAHTHTESFNFPFIWEGWTRK